MNIFIEILPSLLVGIFLAYFNHLQEKRQRDNDRRADLRKKEGKLILEMTKANAKMGYANSMAIIRGRHNGEVEAAIEAYKKAMAEYEDFINENHISYMERNK